MLVKEPLEREVSPKWEKEEKGCLNVVEEL
jgi:hypothetical protein